jgi:putative oxidoreductase
MHALALSALFFAVQLPGGLLLLSSFFVALALTLLAAELCNIVAAHITLVPGIAPALVACVPRPLSFSTTAKASRAYCA